MPLEAIQENKEHTNTSETVRKIQLAELDIFKAFKAICDRHNLRYFAIGGTCIGAIRHKGFVPWDDDMDVAMPYEDYKKFFEIAKTELPEHLVARD
ncbi:MAG: LicD family protein [Synergistaceae bacterium]|nr:LicD family protein [Synergistaceae bacterium]